MQQREPVAIVGMGCRFPGGIEGVDDFWDLLQSGREVVGPVPADRWNAEAFYDPDYLKPGKIIQRRGGFLDDVASFDAAFFGISPREARQIDPQQRLLLETAYQALQNAGIPPSSLAGTATGVFVGISTQDYGELSRSVSERHNVDAYSAAGTALSIAANRLSYVFDLRGPSLSVDTACSSSLSALHTAFSALQGGDCSLALVGGVNVLLRPETTLGFSRAGMLSPTGRCWAFEARADGYVRAEGAGVVVLKPLSRALADRDGIVAVIRATSVNQDGRTTGIMLPSEEAQMLMQREAYRRAGIDPRQVGYIECHGTGTPAGDPIEARALGAVVGVSRSADRPCWIGSVKTNIGHLEAGSGMAGLIKAALCVQKAVIAPNLHFERPNPRIPFDELGLRVARELMPWPDYGPTRIAGVNSFGFGGANAHAVLESAPVTAPDSIRAGAPDRPVVVALSAGTPEGVIELARRYQKRCPEIAASGTPLADLAWTSIARRDAHEHRAALVVSSFDQLEERLGELIEGQSGPSVRIGRATGERSQGVAFVFAGQGPQWWAMGRQFLTFDGPFRQTILECDAHLGKHTTWRILDELQAEESRSRVDRTEIAQPTLFALQVGLARTWESFGIRPVAAVGHSIGEVAAAVTAGALTLEQGVQVVFHRSRVQQTASGKGRMLAVGLSEPDVLALIRDEEGEVWLAATNGPRMVTLSGTAAPLERIARRLENAEIFHRFLRVSVPFHSHYMDPLEDELVSSLAGLKPGSARIPLYSTVTATRVEGSELDAAYWFRNVRDSVRFASAIERMVHDEGVTVFVELSPHPTLVDAVNDILTTADRRGVVVPSLRRDGEDAEVLARSLADLHVNGQDILPVAPGRFVSLPHTPLNRQKHWLESSVSLARRAGAVRHPFLAEHSPSASQPRTHSWELTLDARVETFLADHRVQGPIVFPGAGYLDAALACAQEAFHVDTISLEDVKFERPLFLPDEGEPPHVRLEVAGDEGSCKIVSRPTGGEGEWSVHMSGRIVEDTRPAPARADLEAIRRKCALRIDPATCYPDLAAAGLQFGPLFRTLTEARGRCAEDGSLELLSRIDSPLTEREDPRRPLHTVALDACFQSAILAVLLTGRSLEDVGVYLPTGLERLRVHRRARGTLYCWARIGPGQWKPQELRTDITLFSETGEVIAVIEGFRARYLKGTRSDEAPGRYNRTFESIWVPRDRPDQKTNRRADGIVPSPRDYERALAERANELAADPRLRRYLDQAEHTLNRLSVGYFVFAFRSLAFDFSAGARWELPLRGVDARHARLVGRMLEALSDYLRVERGFCVVERIPEEQDLEREYARALDELPEFRPELTLLKACAPRLAEVLSGTLDPLELLFGPDRWNDMELFYRDAYANSPGNELLRMVVDEIAARHPKSRTLRVLEIGAGTGGATARVLEALPGDRTQYVFSDVSSAYLRKARERFGARGWVDFRTLDIEKDPARQGFEPAEFDLVIAANVLHATPNLRETLAHVRHCLAPGGSLLLLEVTRPPLWIDSIFGLTEGWWKFSDTDQRTDRATLQVDAWERLLAQEGFDDIVVATPQPGPRAGQHALVARLRPTEALEPHRLERRADRGTAWILADAAGVGQALSTLLEDAGFSATCAPAGQGPTLGEVAPRLVVHLGALDSPALDALSARELGALHRISTGAHLELVRELASRKGAAECRIVLVTSGSQPALPDGSPISVPQAAAWGLGRVIQNEFPQLAVDLVDLPHKPTSVDVEALARECLLAGEEREREVALRGTARLSSRVVPVNAGAARLAARIPIDPARDAYHVEIRDSGVLESLTWVKREHRQDLPNGEIQIAIHATGLNFRDLMVAMGLITLDMVKDGFAELSIGIECSGTVVRVGEGVRRFKPGDEVIAFGRNCLGSLATTPESLALHKPKHLTHGEAATLYAAYMTAGIGLLDLGQLKKGESVLVHSGAGGVGHAAIHVARWKGAEVFATAGSESKRQYLRQLGVRHVFDSRAQTFSQEILEETGGRGVDVILNSLSGPAIAASLACLATYGRFIEIGKTDIYGNRRIGLSPYRRNLTYVAFDIDRWAKDGKLTDHPVVEQVNELLQQGVLPPLPHRGFPQSQVADAFRFMASAKHVGKIVVNRDTSPRPGEGPLMGEVGEDASRVRGDATYLITGGLGGFGMELAKGLVARGARHLILMGRSGATQPQTVETIRGLEARGACVRAIAVDVSDADALERALQEVRSDLPPLAGVFHCAMVLRDGILQQMTDAQFLDVMRPKAAGALNLHRLTANDPLDFFVLMSSLSSLYGQPGQGNYVAANAFLEGLAWERRRRGMPATVVNLGVIQDAGFVHRSDNLAERLANQGWIPMRSADVIRLIFGCVKDGAPQRMLAEVDWTRVAGQATEAARRRFEAVFSRTDGRSVHGTARRDHDVKSSLAGLAEKDRRERVTGLLREELTRLTGAPQHQLPADVPLTRLGLDSLVAAQFSAWIHSKLGTDIPVMRILKGPSLEQLAAMVISGLVQAPSGGSKELDSWVVRPVERRGATLRIFCFHQTGGSTESFVPWATALPDTVEVCIVRRDVTSVTESAFPSLDALAGRIVKAMTPLLDRPFAVYGHCGGALIAATVVKHLRREDRVPEHFFVGAMGPERPEKSVDMDPMNTGQVSDEVILRWLRDEVGAPADVISSNRAARAAMIATFRRELRLLREARLPASKMPWPVTAVYGTRDAIYLRENVAKWADHTSGKFELVELDAPHLFLDTHGNQVMEIVRRGLALATA